MLLLSRSSLPDIAQDLHPDQGVVWLVIFDGCLPGLGQNAFLNLYISASSEQLAHFERRTTRWKGQNYLTNQRVCRVLYLLQDASAGVEGGLRWVDNDQVYCGDQILAAPAS